MEEVGHWSGPLMVKTSPLPVYSLLLECRCNRTNQPSSPATMRSLPAARPHLELYKPSGAINQSKLLSYFLPGYFMIAMRKLLICHLYSATDILSNASRSNYFMLLFHLGGYESVLLSRQWTHGRMFEKTEEERWQRLCLPIVCLVKVATSSNSH